MTLQIPTALSLKPREMERFLLRPWVQAAIFASVFLGAWLWGGGVANAAG